MRTYNHVMMLWKYMEFSEKKRLKQKFTRKHGEHFCATEFFEFLSDEYDDSQIEFEADGGEMVKERSAA